MKGPTAARYLDRFVSSICCSADDRFLSTAVADGWFLSAVVADGWFLSAAIADDWCLTTEISWRLNAGSFF